MRDYITFTATFTATKNNIIQELIKTHKAKKFYYSQNIISHKKFYSLHIIINTRH